jgi:hypothetical protein
MALYQLPDLNQARTRASELITNLRQRPIPEIARLLAPYTPGAPSCSPSSAIPTEDYTQIRIKTRHLTFIA